MAIHIMAINSREKQTKPEQQNTNTIVIKFSKKKNNNLSNVYI